MARISELHYSNAYANSSGVSEFLEVALGNGESPADFVVSFYNADGSVGIEVPLTAAGVQVSVDPDNGEFVYVISADFFDIQLTDPDGGQSNNYEAFALTDVGGPTNVVIDFYDIGGGTQNILATDGVAAGAVSDNLGVLTGPASTTTTLQFNQPDPGTLVYDSVGAGDTGIACFVAGCRIDTPDGPRPVEQLRPGDLVLTQDQGPQPLCWVGQQQVSGRGRFAPVRFAAGVLGACRDTWLSPQHRVLIQGWQSELLFGEDEVLIPAKALVNGGTVQQIARDQVTYCHILMDRHQIVCGDGLASESYYPGGLLAQSLGAETAEELFALFPQLRNDPLSYGHTARSVRPVSDGGVLQLGQAASMRGVTITGA